MKFAGLPSAVVLLVAGLLDAVSVEAVTFPIVGRPRPRSPHTEGRLGRRAVDMNGSFGNGSTIVSNSGDTMYLCNITLGGAQFEVLIDTGSSDLWVVDDVPNKKNLNIPAQVSYAEGEASGVINTATLVFDEFTIPDQAFIDVAPSANNPPTSGLIGLGPSSGSKVRSLVKSAAGAPPLDRIFRQNLTTPNFLSVYLSRVADDVPGSTPQTGQLTVGDLIPGLEAISGTTKLPALVDQFGIQHWQTVLDANGIIGPDGQQITTNTSIPNPTVGGADQFHVIFDTGFTLPQVPRGVADAIYGRVPGATFVTQTSSPGYWRIPCDYELSISFVFGGVKYPISPLDMTLVEKVDKSGKPVTCMATFQEISSAVADHSSFGAFDVILGMAFLRNVYLLIDFGDFVDGSNSSVADPYIQLLSTTNTATAHTDFVNARLGGQDTTASQPALLPADQGQQSPDNGGPNTGSVRNTVDSAKQGVKDFYKSKWFLIAAIAGGASLLALLAACIFCRCRRRRSNVRSEAAFVPAMGSYRPLQDPPAAPGHNAPSAGPPEPQTYGAGYGYGNYGYPSQGQYHEPKYQYGGQYGA